MEARGAGDVTDTIRDAFAFTAARDSDTIEDGAVVAGAGVTVGGKDISTALAWCCAVVLRCQKMSTVASARTQASRTARFISEYATRMR